MEPAIHTGSVVIVKPENNYKIGDVITFTHAIKMETPVTHRIYDVRVEGGQSVYITKGDANNALDSAEIAKKNIKGKVLFSIPYLGYIVNFIKKPIGFTLIIVIPAVLIIGDELKKIYNEIKKKKKNEN
jgi:signal peptidase